MIKIRFAPAALVLTGLVGLAACSSGNNGPMTQSAVAAPVPTAAVDPTPAITDTSALSLGLIKQAQTTLRQQGFYKGRIDGLWGPASQTATRGYQNSHNLADSGELDSPTLAALKTASVSDSQATPAPTSKAAAATTN
jgi:peptidoglycan hydrolase-like protein with peptidoglycan-binding domain